MTFQGEAAQDAAAYKLHRPGLAAILQQEQLWECVLHILHDKHASPAVTSAAVALMLVAVATNPQGVGRQLMSAADVAKVLMQLVLSPADKHGHPDHIHSLWQYSLLVQQCNLRYVAMLQYE